MKPFYLETKNETLRSLMAEQLKRHPAWVILPAAPLSDNDGIIINPAAMGFKFPLRLGALVDKINYELSGRTRFAPDDTELSLGDFTLSDDGMNFIQTSLQKTCALTDKEYLIIRALMEAHVSGIDRHTLLDRVWGYADSTETHTVETHMYRLRQKLEADFGNAISILNENSLYKLLI